MSLTDTHLNISSLMGPMSLELLPPPGSPATGGGGLFRRLRASALSGRDDSGTANPVAESKRAHPKYPFCEMRPHGFSLMDYAAFSFLAYLQQDSPSFNAFFRAAFNSDEWAILRGPEPRAHGAVIIDAYNNRLNTSIVAIRGTNPKNLFDIFQVGGWLGVRVDSERCVVVQWRHHAYDGFIYVCTLPPNSAGYGPLQRGLLLGRGRAGKWGSKSSYWSLSTCTHLPHTIHPSVFSINTQSITPPAPRPSQPTAGSPCPLASLPMDIQHPLAGVPAPPPPLSGVCMAWT